MQRFKLYRHFGNDGELLYIGVSISILSRLAQHKSMSHWFDKIVMITIENFNNKAEMYEAETLAIKKEKPKFNQSQLENFKIERNSFIGIPKLAAYLEIPQGVLRTEIQYNRFPLTPVSKRPYFKWVTCKVIAQKENPDFINYLQDLRKNNHAEL